MSAQPIPVYEEIQEVRHLHFGRKLQRYVTLWKRKKELDAEMEALRPHIISLFVIAEITQMVYNQFVISVKNVTRTPFSFKSLVEAGASPELIKKAGRISSYPRLTINKKKEKS